MHEQSRLECESSQLMLVNGGKKREKEKYILFPVWEKRKKKVEVATKGWGGQKKCRGQRTQGLGRSIGWIVQSKTASHAHLVPRGGFKNLTRNERACGANRGTVKWTRKAKGTSHSKL